MVSSTSARLSLLLASCYYSVINATPVDNDNLILDRIKKSGDCVGYLFTYLHLGI